MPTRLGLQPGFDTKVNRHQYHQQQRPEIHHKIGKTNQYLSLPRQLCTQFFEYAGEGRNHKYINDGEANGHGNHHKCRITGSGLNAFSGLTFQFKIGPKL